MTNAVIASEAKQFMACNGIKTAMDCFPRNDNDALGLK